ncbi:MAG: DegT/DnrJ/EryC1/StrS aminotransferase family protein [Oscillospiraceae bacterium]|jgi:pyridoxal phosphate-dependent aminotransferase EpsN|nr:DegT/DnrJ/EryC1/StrS aminotransferase family protein [Oscillospiraceae bacterium]
MGKRIFLSPPLMNGTETEYINSAFKSNRVAPFGHNTELFERSVRNYLGCRHSLALSSGTAGIHISLRYLGVEPGDVVFCSSLTFAASCMPILYECAEPVFIDSDSDSWNMSPSALRTALERYSALGRLPKAVVVADIYGLPAKYDEILSICVEFKVPVVEDAAEALGSAYKGKMCGTYGDIGVLSFNSNKIITTSGGGMVVTDIDGATDKMKYWSAQSREPLPYYEHREIGYNYRLSDICAGIGRGQMNSIERYIERRREINGFYRREFAGYPVSFPNEIVGAKSNCWLSVILIENGVPPSMVIEALERDNIEARRCWKPMSRQPVFKDCEFFACPGADNSSVGDELFAKGLCLPSGTAMDDEDLRRIVGIVKKAIT